MRVPSHARPWARCRWRSSGTSSSCPTLGNPFYFASELVMTRVLIDLTKRGSAAKDSKETEDKALRKLHDAAVEALGR